MKVNLSKKILKYRRGLCAICMSKKFMLSYMGQKIVPNVQRGNGNLFIHEPG